MGEIDNTKKNTLSVTNETDRHIDKQSDGQTPSMSSRGHENKETNHQCYIVNDNCQNVLGISNNIRSNRGQNQFVIIAPTVMFEKSI